ncbi:lipoprotein [Roseibium sp. MMSF_3544]|uniref:LPS translocon maturation chaperone LptM n=1 Tax=unclassified Roseibium TaxID=2629323 RepID=UPI00273DB945|nr:lipoprotein [Roseibium sp. MMSF_3544]
MTTRFKILALIGLCLSLTLAGCGRKGALDVPGTPEAAETGAVDPADAPPPPQLEPESEKESFFLDFLIN